MGRLVRPISEEEYNDLSSFGKWWQDNGLWVILIVMICFILILANFL